MNASNVLLRKSIFDAAIITIVLSYQLSQSKKLAFRELTHHLLSAVKKGIVFKDRNLTSITTTTSPYRTSAITSSVSL